MPRRSVRTNERGLTLIELLVVMLILGILVAIALPTYLSSVTSADKRTCQANMTIIANAMQMFRTNDVSHLYPSTLDALMVGPVATPGGTATPDLMAIPKCPEDMGNGDVLAGDPKGYLLTVGATNGVANSGPITITCQADTVNHGSWSNGILTVP